MNVTMEKYNLISDERQYIVSEMRTVKEGRTAGDKTKVNQTYHPTLRSALNNILERKFKESKATTWEGLKNDLKIATDWIREQVPEVDIRLNFTEAWEEAHK